MQRSSPPRSLGNRAFLPNLKLLFSHLIIRVRFTRPGASWVTLNELHIELKWNVLYLMAPCQTDIASQWCELCQIANKEEMYSRNLSKTTIL